VCWREEERDGNVTKIPVDPSSGGFASTTDPDSWTDFETAQAYARDAAAGVGFVFSEADPIVGVDLDACRDPESGRPAEWATDVIGRLESFTEVSPSGTGFHVLVEGSVPGGRNRRWDVEVYETGRFFTVTGDHVDGTPTEIRERGEALASVYGEYLAREEFDASPPGETSAACDSKGVALDDGVVVEKARSAANGAKFGALYRGSTSGYESQSEADMALCSLLAFWTGGDARQMDRLFRASGLMRGKWDEQHYADGSTYGEKTIERAIAGTSEFYEPSSESTSSSTRSTSQASDSEHSSRRAEERVERIAELETRLREVLDEKEALQADLQRERARREEVEAELAAERASDGGLFSWLLKPGG
jgi:primase-polymerase (primpol)-like protein